MDTVAAHRGLVGKKDVHWLWPKTPVVANLMHGYWEVQMNCLRLSKGQIVLFKRRIARLSCTHGGLWVHWKKGEDVHLRRGESLECRRYSLVQIHALKDSTIEIEPVSVRRHLQSRPHGRPASPSNRLAQGWTGLFNTTTIHQ
jgi:hypothetical protein